MSDLNREQFEEWFDESGFKKFKETAWNAWQASRECLVIDLPPEPEYPEDPEEAIDDSHMDSYHSAIIMRNACRDSIHAAGAKTK